MGMANGRPVVPGTEIRIDPSASCAEIASLLKHPPPEEPSAHPRPPRRWRTVRRWFGGAALALACGLVWLNGPGVRWLGPQAAQHFLKIAGLDGSVRIEGSLSHGLSITDVELRGGSTLASLTVERATPHYQWSRLVKGQLDGLSVEGVHADLRLGLATADPAQAGRAPLDLEQLIRTVRAARRQIAPMQLDFKRLSLTATRAGKPAIKLEPSRLSQAAGSDQITLEIGKITGPDGREYPAQTAHLAWTIAQISLDQLAVLPGLGVSGLTLSLPASGGPSLEALIRLDAAVLRLQTGAGLASARLALISGSVDLQKSLARFKLEVPAAATLSAFTLEAANLMPNPAAATGRVELTLESLAYQEWQVPQALIRGVLEHDRAHLTLLAQALGSPVSLDAEFALAREGGKLVPGDAGGTFQLANIPTAIRELAAHSKAIHPAANVPPASLDGSFKLTIRDSKLLAADIDTTIQPADPVVASPIVVHARWQPERPASAELSLDGLRLCAHYDSTAMTYDGTLALDGFANSRIDAWLAIAGVSAGGNANLTGQWQGGGDLANKTHRGELALTQATWQQPGKAPITAAGTIRYNWPDHVAASDLQAHTGQQSLTLDLLQATWQPQDKSASACRSPWPGTVAVRGLKVQAADQTLTLEAALVDGLLKLDSLIWRDGATVIAQGSASLPVPQDPAKWRDTLAKDTRPASMSLESAVLSLDLLEPWLPAAAKLDPRATGQVHINLSGTYVEPALAATIECLNLRSPANPKLPPAALKLALKTRDGRLTLDGSVTTPDYAPAVLTASIPFRPAAWADAPDTLKQESVTARADLPRLDLSRATNLLPLVRQISGSVTGNLVVTGKLGAPEVHGAIQLTNVGIIFADPKLPAVNSAAADIGLTLNAISLKHLRASIAGGNLSGEGALSLTDGKPAALDFRLRGDHLPLLRNDMLILRANLDLRLQGPWQTASLTGTVGAVDSLFYRDIELLPIGKPFTTPSAAALPRIDVPQSRSSTLPAPFGNWGLNVAVRTQAPFLIRGNLATGRVDANLRIGGSLGTPQPDGVVTLTDFVAVLPFSTLKVKSGTLRFTPASGFDPILEIRGVAAPRPYRIDAYVYGKVSDPQLVLTSNPPLPENDIMTLLATGTTSAGLENTQAASARAIQLFAEEVRRGRVRYTRQLRPLLGLLDHVDFSLAEADPYSSTALSTATINLSDHWLVSAGMGQDGNTRVMGIWRVSFR
jgi:hypothetical protein